MALTSSHFGTDDNPKSKQQQQQNAAMPPKVKSDKENKVNIKKGAEGRGEEKRQWARGNYSDKVIAPGIAGPLGTASVLMATVTPT